MDPKAQTANAFVISIILLGVLAFYYGGDKVAAWWEETNKPAEESKDEKKESAFKTVLKSVVGAAKGKEEKTKMPAAKNSEAEEGPVVLNQRQPAAAQETVEQFSQAAMPMFGALRGNAAYYSSAQGGSALGTFNSGEVDIIDWPPESSRALVAQNGFSGWVSKNYLGDLTDGYGLKWQSQ